MVFALTSFLEAFGIGLIGGFLGIAGNPSSIFDNFVLRSLYDAFAFQSADIFLIFLGLSIVVVFIFKALSFLLGKAYTFYCLFRQQSTIQKRLFSAYIFAPYEFHLSQNTAQFSTNIILESSRFTNLVAVPLAEFCSQIIVIFTLLTLLTIQDRVLLLCSMATILPVFLSFLLLSKRLKNWGQLAGLARQRATQIVNQGLGGIKETRVVGCESYFEEQLSINVEKQAHLSVLFSTSQFVPKILVEMLLVTVIVGFMCISQFLLNHDFQTTVSSLGVFAIAAFRLAPAISGSTQSLGKLRNSVYTLDALHTDLRIVDDNGFNRYHVDSSKQKSERDGNLVEPFEFKNNLNISRLMYRYPTSESMALDGISLKIRRGESIGLIGKSGAGKTTLVDVLLALLIPESGDIEVDGRSIYENLSAWKALVGYIPQTIFLLDDTIERNIAFGVQDKFIDKDRLEYAIKAAQLEELMQTLPEGVKTSVGERGVRLSGGQRQRIGIARALYHQREILVLDEATSALDNETERLVSESIGALSGKSTLIIIAHRLTTLQDCDRVYVLDQGKVVREGSYEDVILSN